MAVPIVIRRSSDIRTESGVHGLAIVVLGYLFASKIPASLNVEHTAAS